MSTANSNMRIAAVITFLTLVLVSHFAFAASAADMSMEAALLCEDGQCQVNGATPGLGEPVRKLSGSLRDIVKHVNVFSEDGTDPRVAVARRGKYAPIGTVTANVVSGFDSKGKPVREVAPSTAFLVSPCHVMTTYHSVFGLKSGMKPNEAQQVKFSVGEGTNGSYKFKELNATVVANGSGKQSFGASDWAILKLSNCVGNDPAIGWMDMSASEVMSDNIRENVQIAGLYGDKLSGQVPRLFAQEKCKILNVTHDFTLSHTCASRPGTSGAPIFFTESDGVPRVVAMHVSAVEVGGVVSTKHTRAGNYSVNMDEAYEKAGAEIDAAIASVGGKNPQVAMIGQQPEVRVASSQRAPRPQTRL